MKAVLTSSDIPVEVVDAAGRPVIAHIWRGVSPGGIAFVAYVTRVQAHDAAQQPALLRELSAPTEGR